MSDQLSKVVAEMREKATALAAACEEHKPAKNMGDLALLDVLPAVAETLIDWADRIESAAAPVEVDGLTPYARCVAAINSLDDFARMDTGVDPAGPRAAAFSALDELARQLAESESALAAATRRVAEVEVALSAAAASLNAVATLAGKDPYMDDMESVRGYAANRALVANKTIDARLASDSEGGSDEAR